jgi:hypothetical protein
MSSIFPSYMSPNTGVGGSQPEYSCAHGAQINFGNQTLYLTYVSMGQVVLSFHFKGLSQEMYLAFEDMHDQFKSYIGDAASF